MTTPHQPAHDILNALKNSLFRLYDHANQPDIVWTEDGPAWGDTYHDADSLELAADIIAAEDKLTAALREHRDELGADPRWQPFYAELDESEATHTGSDGQSLDDQFRYRVEVSHPATIFYSDTLADAYQWARDHLASDRIEVPPTGRVMLEIYARESDSPMMGGYETPEQLDEKLRREAFEDATAQTLLLAQAEVQRRRTAARGDAVDTWSRPTDITQTTANQMDRIQALLQDRPIEALICQWAVTEAPPTKDLSANEWSSQMQAAGLRPQVISFLAECMDRGEVMSSPQHPAVQQRDSAMRDLVVYYTDQRLAGDYRNASAPGPPDMSATRSTEAPTIQRLVDAAHPPVTAGQEQLGSAEPPPVVESPSATAETEIEP
ncbi:hypothetical protein HLB23_24560 [Nocardia uniformis]|uniref:Uncharacterized protein n=1 Tax=Nocardia uniformis TaxID=53432 RepID=A0A849C2V0_9NOCA|nr:hypothetical protein [Nocardia uniformis]NNH72994.1 hypothetical protein [Nocardia uniformis]